MISVAYASPHVPSLVFLSAIFTGCPNSRFHRQLSEPCLAFLTPKNRGTVPYQPASHEKRPTYQRHLSEPLVPHGQPVLKQELIDPRYPDTGLPAPSLAQHPVTIKKEPQDFTFDRGVKCVCLSVHTCTCYILSTKTCILLALAKWLSVGLGLQYGKQGR